MSRDDGASMRTGGAGTAVLVGLLALAVLLNFVDRGAIGVAAPLMKQDLGLSATAFGIAVSAFFWTYGPLQPLLGWLADRWSAALVLAGGVLLWALATLLTGHAVGLGGLVLLRLLLGLGEGFLFPCVSKLIAGHVPAERRGLANAVVAVGLALGPAAGTLAGGAILAQAGWRAVFVLSGLVTLVWLVPWFLVARRLSPVPHNDQRSGQRYGALLRNRALWLMGLCHACANYGFFFVSTWLPLYLVKSRGLPIGTMALYAGLMYGAQAVASLCWGQMSDRLVRLGHDEGAVRRGLSVVGLVGSVLAIGAIAMATGPGWLLAALLVTGVFLGCLPTMVYAIGQLYAGPARAASWIGIQNAIGSLSGIIGPVVTGLIVDLTGGFGGAFAFCAAVSALGAVLFAFALPPVPEAEAAGNVFT
ncbi:MFS transporter [Novosphingobium sp.]|uniref:MFS transporter n=1 Tax=Novosphingobium sp. TaxID=1874826 RepID=UPI0038BD3824